MSAADWEVATPPPPSGDQPAGAPGEQAPPITDAPPAGPQLPVGWTPDDIASLVEIVRGPYDKMAEVTNDDAYKLSKIDELALVSVLTTWMPVSWVRAGAHGQLPLIVALPLTGLVLGVVTLPKLLHWNRAHPESAIAIPFITKRGGPRGQDRPRPTAVPADERGRVDEQPGRGSPNGTPAGDAAPEPASSGTVDGGPPADSLDDIRRRYAGR